MARIVKRLTQQLIDKGIGSGGAKKMAVKILTKQGNTFKDGTPTKQGMKRGNMTPAERAIDRMKDPMGNYGYNPKTNKAFKK